MISKEGFCKALRMIKEQEAIDDQFSKALEMVGSGHFAFGADNKYLLTLRNVLKETVGDQYDYIDWWLYEATDDYEVWEADKPLKYCLLENALSGWNSKLAEICPSEAPPIYAEQFRWPL